ncbi:MAG: hypothetical protein HOH74_08930 [Gemmatimonadetes bacterium]|nr:hypothetical protein [Gemmatimonadota bacterium]
MAKMNRLCVAALLMLISSALPGEAGGNLVWPDTLRSYATLHSLGLEWDVRGDANHDATCAVRYRRSGTMAWQQALDLIRVDYDGYYANTVADRAYNMLAGSLFFLDPGTSYDVELTLADPDGGQDRRVIELSTRPEPVLPVASVVYVHADTTSGDGSLERPVSLPVALAQALPGRVHCLLPGRYGQVNIQRSGEPTAPIAWLGPAASRAVGYGGPEGEAEFERIEVSASHVWIEGLLFDKSQAWPDSITRGGLRGLGEATRVVVRGNHFRDYPYSIWLHPDNSAWVISDNTIIGRKDIEQEGSAAFSGEGIELHHSSHHTIAYNSISHVADGISYAQRNVDIFGNDIFDTSDDGIEPDYGYANLRIWGNRIANVQYHAFSFQGMYCGPWYFIRNQVTTARGALFKFRTADRLVFVNNTLGASTFGRDIMHHLLHGFVRNNLFIRDGLEARDPWRARLKYVGRGLQENYYTPDLTAPDGRTDWDYSGYDLRDSEGAPGLFHWFDESYERVEALSAAVGIETHGRHVDRERVFADYRPPTHPARLPRPVLYLHPEGEAVDAGDVVPNLADQFIGQAPDLGAHEVGGREPHYGPRQPEHRHRWLDPGAEE